MIDSTEFGLVVVNGKIYRSDVLVFWDGEVKKLEVSVRHLFGMPEFREVEKRRPEVLIIGNGQYGLLEVSREVIDACDREGIKFFKMNSKEAIKKFNEILREGRRVVAFIHVTC